MKRETLAGIAIGLLLAGCALGSPPDPDPEPTPAPTVSATTAVPTVRPTTAPTASASASRTPTVQPSTSRAPEATQEPMVQSDGFTCRDGSVSHAQHRQGACSHHGGVA